MKWGDEMRRIWNALRYGDAETRKCIGSVIFFSVLGVVLIAVSAVISNFYLFIFGLLSIMFGVIGSQTFTLVDDDFVAETNKEGDKNTVQAVTVKRTVSMSGQNKSGQNKSGRKKPEAAKEPAEIPQPKDLMEKQAEVPEEKEEKEHRKKHGYEEEDFIEPAQFHHYTKAALAKVKKKYRLRKDHRPIIIDSSESYRIKECPAFIWRIHNKVYLLLLEKEPRRISISRDLIRHMGYKPNVEANPSEEYLAFRKEGFVTGVFKEFLPDYKTVKGAKGRTRVKNLYTIYPDICITNKSVDDVMDLLCLNFMPEDKITKSDVLNGFFKRIYAAHILYTDQVYGIMEYKAAVEEVLKDLCYSDLLQMEFSVTLDNLIKGRLISEEYADYYREMRKKILLKREGGKSS